MKIGVYGDSFAHQAGYNMDIHWSNLLKDELDTKVYNYGMKGSSIYYSYKKFLETYTEYDYNVFVVTHFGRFHKYLELEYLEEKDSHLHSINAIDNFIKYHPSKTVARNMKTLLKLKGWYELMDDEYLVDVTNLMLEKVHTLDSKVIFIPSFYNSYVEKITNNSNNLCNHIYRLQEHCGIDTSTCYNIYDENPNTIAGHFNLDFNRAIAKMIKKKIETDIWDWEILENTTITGKKEDYYILKT